MSGPEQGPTPEDITHKLSKTVLHASERRRQGLFEKLTAANAEKIAELTREKPRFYEKRQDAPGQLLLEPEVAKSFPEKFFENPTEWLEAQPNIKRGHTQEELPTGETIAELWAKPYDVSKVKQFDLHAPEGKDFGVVSKRILPKELDEVARARRAFEAGIPTPRVLGEILDRGNVYVLFEHIPGINLQAAYNNAEKKNFSAMPHRFFEETTEDQFDNAMQQFGKNLPSELRQKMKALWKKALPDLQEDFLLGTVQGGFHGRTKKELEEVLDRDFKLRPLGAKRILRSLKIGSVKEIVLRNLNHEGYGLYGFRENTAQVQQSKDQSRSKLKKYSDKWHEMMSVHFFGVDTKQEKEKIQALLDRAKISHKDLAMRNFVIPWDFEKDRPAKRKAGQPGLYLVDWESGRSSS